MNKAIFMDLDHTLIKPKSGETFPKDIDDWEFIPSTIKWLKSMTRPTKGKVYVKYTFVIVTNQGGVERGYLTETELKKKMKTICNALRSEIKVAPNRINWIACTTNDEANENRKPNPGMVYATANYLDIDIANSIFIGDRKEDKLCAINAHMKDFRNVLDLNTNLLV